LPDFTSSIMPSVYQTAYGMPRGKKLLSRTVGAPLFAHPTH
jgi:hypothetical protein